jgi:hypothetical protein
MGTKSKKRNGFSSPCRCASQKPTEYRNSMAATVAPLAKN